MDLSHKGKYAAPIEGITEKIQKSFSIDEEDMETYHMYIKDGKDAARQGNCQKPWSCSSQPTRCILLRNLKAEL
uniref:Uncharacterized protein n=1 Tax=Anguilla anguilla TaxID=7936 RepID=A0A0E9PZB6_ANGAN